MAKEGVFNPAELPAWVSDGSKRKYDRAVAQLTKANADRVARKENVVPITEEDVKDLYVKFGGLVVGDETTARGVIPVDAPKTPEAPRGRGKAVTEKTE